MGEGGSGDSAARRAKEAREDAKITKIYDEENRVGNIKKEVGGKATEA